MEMLQERLIKNSWINIVDMASFNILKHLHRLTMEDSGIVQIATTYPLHLPKLWLLQLSGRF